MQELRLRGLQIHCPTKTWAAAREAEDGDTSGNSGHPVGDGRAVESRWLAFLKFHSERQVMQHVGERFNVHQPMFNRYVEQSGQRKAVRGCAGIESYPLKLMVEGTADIAYIIADRVLGGPVRRQIGWKLAANRIDAEGKETIIFGVDAPQSKGALAEQIPIKGFEMSDIKDDAVPLGNRPFIK